MNGCQTCGGFGMHHDPIAHGTENDEQTPRKVIVLHMVYPDGTHTGDCEGCLWDQGFCPICGDDHEPQCRNHREPGDPEWTARELLSGLPDEDDA